MNIPETPPPLSPLRPRRLFTNKNTTRKQINIEFNPVHKKSMQRMRTIKQRAIQHMVQSFPKINPDGSHHLILYGEPSNLRTVLGTNHIVTNVPNENIMRNSRIRAELQMPTVLESRRFKPATKVNRSSLLRNVLEKRFKNAQNKTKRTASILPRRIDFA